MVPPNHLILPRFSIIFTIHFGVPLLEMVKFPYSSKVIFFTDGTNHQGVEHIQWPNGMFVPVPMGGFVGDILSYSTSKWRELHLPTLVHYDILNVIFVMYVYFLNIPTEQKPFKQ